MGLLERALGEEIKVRDWEDFELSPSRLSIVLTTSWNVMKGHPRRTHGGGETSAHSEGGQALHHGNEITFLREQGVAWGVATELGVKGPREDLYVREKG